MRDEEIRQINLKSSPSMYWTTAQFISENRSQ